MKIVVLDGYTLNPGDLSWEGLEKLGNLTVYDRTPEYQIRERIKGAKVVFTNKTVIKKDVLENNPELKYIGILATGYNTVDIEGARELGITVTNIPAYSTKSVAQFAMALLLEMCHHVGHHSDEVRSGRWSKHIDFCFWDYPLIELDGKTLGIIGYGSTGQAFSQIAQAMGMNVLAHTRTSNKDLETDQMKYASLDDLLAQSDVISLHCPLFEETKGIINKDNIQKMKDGVMIINTGRGPLIVEEDLANALNSGKVAGAGLDVLAQEPPKADNPLLTAKNCIITPHIAWAPQEARSRLMDMAVDNLKKFMAGESQNVVN